MLSSFLSVRRSSIQGKGVFALKNIRKGVRVIEYKGTLRKDDVLLEPGNWYVDLFDLGNGFVIDPKKRGNMARFINHSCSPNCESIMDGDRVFIQSIRAIKAGEELKYDYRLSLGRQPTTADKRRYQCRCGSATCRGTLYKIPKKRKKRATRLPLR
jgi:SET domain-containing protein